jgi:hypothetical protein
MKIENARIIKHYSGKKNAHGKIYFNIKCETVFENLTNRRTRPYNEFRKFIPSILESLALDIDPKNFRWSQKAGCDCGCSPGFVDKDYRMTFKDIYVDIVS